MQRARSGEVVAGTAPYGFRFTPDRKTFEVEESEALIIRKIFRMAADGVGLNGIASALMAGGVPTPRGQRGAKVSGDGRTWSRAVLRQMVLSDCYLPTPRTICGRSSRAATSTGRSSRASTPRRSTGCGGSTGRAWRPITRTARGAGGSGRTRAPSGSPCPSPTRASQRSRCRGQDAGSWATGHPRTPVGDFGSSPAASFLPVRAQDGGPHRHQEERPPQLLLRLRAQEERPRPLRARRIVPPRRKDREEGAGACTRVPGEARGGQATCRGLRPVREGPPHPSGAGAFRLGGAARGHPAQALGAHRPRCGRDHHPRGPPRQAGRAGQGARRMPRGDTGAWRKPGAARGARRVARAGRGPGA
ncbi:MAG: recombinase family protein [Rubrobacteraceae bacterium]